MKKYMKYISPLILCLILLMSCNDEWKDEQYLKEVSFVKSGVSKIYLKYDEAGGVKTFKIPIEISGSTDNTKDVSVTIALEKDTLNGKALDPNGYPTEGLNFDNFRYRKDLYYLELDPKYYTFKSMSGTIHAGENIGYIDVDFSLQGIDMYDKHILPLQITETSEYTPATRKYYRKSLMQLILFNDYSGKYVNSGKLWDRDKSEGSQEAIVIASRTAQVVNENTVFFYAGNIEEEGLKRKEFRIYMTFNDDGTVTLVSNNPDIHFSQQAGAYVVRKEIDAKKPYLERTYTTVTLKYEYDDITYSVSDPFRYRYDGSMTMERVRNTTIPDEDQQYIFD